MVTVCRAKNIKLMIMVKIIRNYLLQVICTVAFIFLSVGCEKEPSSTVGKSSFIRGTAYYQNPVTLALDSSNKTEVILLEEYNDDEYFAGIASANSAAFFFGPLGKGNYKLDLSYDFPLDTGETDFITFKMDTIVNLDGDGITLNLPELMMHPAEDYRLLIRTHDEQNNPLPGMQVCLYQNSLLLDGNYKCQQAEFSKTSDNSGIVLFTGLLPATYYFKTFGSIGDNLYDNFYEGAVISTEKPITNESLNEVNVTLKEPIENNTRLKIYAVDTSGYPLRNIKVCLYRNPNLIDTTYNCSYSDVTQLTMNDGSSLFNYLDTVKYYIKATGRFGDFGYSNLYEGAVNSTVDPLIEGKERTIELILRREDLQ
jgi:hypothetical protein